MNFKRVGKRKRNAEMEEELYKLRKRLSTTNELPKQEPASPTPQNGQLSTSSQYMPLRDQIESNEVVGALLDMSRGIDGLRRSETKPRQIEDVFLSGIQVQELFHKCVLKSLCRGYADPWKLLHLLSSISAAC